MRETTLSAGPTTYVDWHCRACGFQHETERYCGCYPVKCPQCNKTETQHGIPRLPVNRVSRDREPKQYDLLGGPKTVQVYLFAATGERAGYSMDPERVPDCDDDPIEVAQAVLDIRDTDKVRAVLNAMLACQEESDTNARVNRLHVLRKSIVLGVAEYLDLSEEQS